MAPACVGAPRWPQASAWEFVSGRANIPSAAAPEPPAATRRPPRRSDATTPTAFPSPLRSRAERRPRLAHASSGSRLRWRTALAAGQRLGSRAPAARSARTPTVPRRPTRGAAHLPLYVANSSRSDSRPEWTGERQRQRSVRRHCAVHKVLSRAARAAVVGTKAAVHNADPRHADPRHADPRHATLDTPTLDTPHPRHATLDTPTLDTPHPRHAAPSTRRPSTRRPSTRRTLDTPTLDTPTLDNA